MENDMKNALASGDLATILATQGADESYRCRYEPVCGHGHDHSDRAVTMDLFRWGAGIWYITGDGTYAYRDTGDVAEAASTLGRLSAAFRALGSVQDAASGTTGKLTVEHTVNGEVSLVDTAFADTVIPASLPPHGWDSV